MTVSAPNSLCRAPVYLTRGQRGREGGRKREGGWEGGREGRGKRKGGKEGGREEGGREEGKEKE